MNHGGITEFPPDISVDQHACRAKKPLVSTNSHESSGASSNRSGFQFFFPEYWLPCSLVRRSFSFHLSAVPRSDPRAMMWRSPWLKLIWSIFRDQFHHLPSISEPRSDNTSRQLKSHHRTGNLSQPVGGQNQRNVNIRVPIELDLVKS